MKYENFARGKRKDSYVLDFSQFKGAIFDENWLEKISEHLESVQKDLHRFTDGHARIQVITQSKREFDLQREAWRKAQETQLLSFSESPDSSNVNEE